MIDFSKLPRPETASNEEHSEYAPSGSKRWMTCTASIQLLRIIRKSASTVPPVENAYAKEGTGAHELGATCLENKLEPESFLSQLFNGVEVDREMIKYISQYVDYVNSLVEWNSVLWVEVRSSMAHIEPDMLGTSDAVILHHPDSATPFVMTVIDLKYGKGVVVEAKDNYQLRIYALGILVHLAKSGVKFLDDDQVCLTIAQPRIQHEDGPFRHEILRIRELREFQKRVIEKVNESKSPDAVFEPNEDNCRWCDASPICKAYTDYNLEAARLDFQDFSLADTQFKRKLTDKALLSKEDLTKIYLRAKEIKKWLESIEVYISNQVKSGDPFEGFKLVYGRSNRIWKDSKEAETILKRAVYWEILEEKVLDELYTKKFISPAQIENLLDTEGFELIKGYITKPLGKVSLAKTSDPRPSIDSSQEAIEAWSQGDDGED